VSCTLSGKVTVTASPYTGCVHHAQDRTGCTCRRRGRLTFAMLRPFRAPLWAHVLTPVTGNAPPHMPGACRCSLGSASGRPGVAQEPYDPREEGIRIVVDRGRAFRPCADTVAPSVA